MQVHPFPIIFQLTTPGHIEPWVMEILDVGSHLHLHISLDTQLYATRDLGQKRKEEARAPGKYRGTNSIYGIFIMFPAPRKSCRDPFTFEILLKLSIWMKPVGRPSICFIQRMNSWNWKKAVYSFPGYSLKFLDLKYLIMELKMAT